MAHKISEITVAEREREANRDRLKSILNSEAAMELRGGEAKELDKLVVGQETSPEAAAVHSTSLGHVDRLMQKRDARQLEEARQAGLLRDVPFDVLRTMIAGSIEAFLRDDTLSAQEYANALETMIDIFLEGVLKR